MSADREEAFLRLVRGETRGPLAALGRAGLRVASWGYGLGAAVRNRGFDRGWRNVARAGVPVVSVGNLTLGGTGKTPTVEWVARWFRERGIRVAILSRGYRQGSGEGVNDEALVLDENLPDVPHLQDPDRVALARVAVEELESELLVLDDGFQHRRLARDLDVVLLDALDPFGLGHLFPRGLLREPISSLRRAGAVIITRADLVDAATRSTIRARAERTAGPRPIAWAEARHGPVAVIGVGAEPEPVASLQDRTVAAFCGIGNPDGFLRTITPLCGGIAGFRRFPDHHAYGFDDVAEIIQWARELKADLVLTTQKDLVKLRCGRVGAIPLRALRVGLEFLSGQEAVEQALASLSPSLGSAAGAGGAASP